MKIKVSVIVPCFNASKTIRKCVESIFSQVYTNWELILVDDGSTDNTAEICSQIAEIDSRVKFIRKKNGGVSSARNVGLKHVTGDYVLFLDSDDYLSEECFCAIDNKNVDILFFGILLFSDNGKVEKWSDVPNLVIEDVNDRQMFIKEYLVTDLFRSPCGKFFREDKIKNFSFNENMKLGEDTDFVIRVVNDCNSFESVSNYYYCCTDHRQVGPVKYRMSPEKSALHLRQIILSYKQLGVKSLEFEKLMFKIFYSVLDQNVDAKMWYKNPLVIEFEKKYLDVNDYSFYENYMYSKSPYSFIYGGILKRLFKHPKHCVLFINSLGSRGMLRPLFLQNIFY